MLRLGAEGEKGVIVEEEAPHPKQEPKSKTLQVLSMASELGFAIALPIAGGAFFGQLLDTKFGTSPRMTLSLIFTGVFLAGANIYFIVKQTKEN